MLTEESCADGGLPPKERGEFRIVHFSDLHFHGGNVPLTTRFRRLVHRARPDGAEVMGSVLADLANVEADHIVITGDVTESARVEDYEAATRLLAPLGGTSRVSVVPGNHDVGYTRDRREAAPYLEVPMKLRRFMRFFGHLMPDAHSDDLRLDVRQAFPFVKILGGGQIALIGIDTTSRIPRHAVPFNALGIVGKKQLRALQKMLASEALREKTKVVLMHHHLLLIPFSEWGDSVRGLRRSRQLLEMLYSARVDLVLHGHKHYPFCWQSHAFRRHNLAVVCAGPPNARWMDSSNLEDTLIYNVYSFRGGTVRIHYRICPHRQRRHTTTFRHHQ